MDEELEFGYQIPFWIWNCINLKSENTFVAFLRLLLLFLEFQFV